MNEVFIPAVAALAGAIAILYRQQLATLNRIERKLDECEQDRKKLWERIVEIEASR